MAPFDIGDVVVCVDARPNEWWSCVGQSWVTRIALNSVHRVTGAFITLGGPVVLLDGEAPHTCDCCVNSTGWNPDRFRKIGDETTEEFREQMRSLGKVRERVS